MSCLTAPILDCLNIYVTKYGITGLIGAALLGLPSRSSIISQYERVHVQDRRLNQKSRVWLGPCLTVSFI